jgi:hypothetical protein
MDEADGGGSVADLTTISQALEVLRREWGRAYRIGHDDVRGWWAQRRDNLGGEITADDPDTLHNAISEDYVLKPVPSVTAGFRKVDGEPS